MIATRLPFPSLPFFAAAAGLRQEAATQAVAKSLAMARLDPAGRDPLGTLAAGHAKHLLIARALLHDPEVLLFDDPFAGLDASQARAVEQLIGDACLMGKTVLAAVAGGRVSACFTHLAVLREGRLVAEGRNDPAAFAEGRRWRFMIRSSGHAAEAARAVAPLVAEAELVDDDTLVVSIDLAVVGPPSLVAALVRAGLPVEAAGYEPPWQAQV